MRYKIPAVFAVVAAAGLLAACGGSTGYEAVPVSSSPLVTAPGPATVAVTSRDGDVMWVTFTKLAFPATGAGNSPAPGERFAVAYFTLNGIRGTSSGIATREATLVDSADAVYTASSVPVAGTTVFGENGAYLVRKGTVLTGTVSFEIPDGAAIRTVQWGPLTGPGPAQWSI